MTTAIKRRRGTTAQHASFTGLEGEITVDTTKETLVVHDGATAGGFPLAKESGSALSPSSVTLSGGTANGVTYLNGSKVLTSGSALTFDGTTLAAGTASGISALLTHGASSIWGVKVIASGSNELQFSGNIAANSGPSIRGVTSGGAAYAPLTMDGSYLASLISGSEQMRLTSTGLGIGTSSPVEKLDVRGNGQFRQADGSYLRFTSTSSVADIEFSNTPALRFVYNGTTERARIDSNGNLLVGLTSAIVADGKFQVKNSSISQATGYFQNATTTGNAIFASFGTEASYTERGSISYNRAGGLTAYNTTSDYRAKDISGPVVDSGALIDSVPVYMGKMKGATQERPMFIAHEVPAYAHTGEKDAVDANGNPVYQQMDTSALVPVMWAEIQSLRQRLAALEAA